MTKSNLAQVTKNGQSPMVKTVELNKFDMLIKKFEQDLENYDGSKSLISDAIALASYEIGQTGIAKSMNVANDKLRFKARGIEDILQVITPIVSRFLLSISSTVLEHSYQNNTCLVLCSYTIHFKNETRQYSSIGKGAGPFALSSAQTFAYKSFLSQAFMISEGWDEQKAIDDFERYEEPKKYNNNYNKPAHNSMTVNQIQKQPITVGFEETSQELQPQLSIQEKILLRANDLLMKFQSRLDREDHEIQNDWENFYKAKVMHDEFPSAVREQFFTIMNEKAIDMNLDYIAE